MITQIEEMRPMGTGRMASVANGFQVMLCIDDSKSSQEFEAILQRLGTRCVTAIDFEQAREAAGAIEKGLAVASFGFSGRSTGDLISLLHNLGGGLPFAFWAPDLAVELVDVIAAIRSGAVDVIQGDLCDSKVAKLIEQTLRQLGLHSNEVRTNGHRQSWESKQAVSGVALLNKTRNGCDLGVSTNRDIAGPFDRESKLPTVAGDRNGTRTASSNHCADKVALEVGEQNLIELIRGNSPPIEAIRNVIRHVAPTQASVMIHGESGTGKELVARAIHALSKRSLHPFVPVNMSAIPHGLAESFLFGHEKGAFTSAVQRQKGCCRVAHGGTLFLDEIGEMELSIQPKLLRFLQEGTIQTVGAQTAEKVDVRVLTATNLDPLEIVNDGRLREDLYFRLNVVPIFIPPLRDRSGDVEELAMLFLQRSAKRHERPVRGFTDDAMDVLVRFDWPGNVRQLENLVERVVIFAKGELVEAMEIPAELHNPSQRRYRTAAKPNGDSHNEKCYVTKASADNSNNIIDRLSPFQINERTVIIDALQRADGHVVDAAKLLGLGQATMYRKIKQYCVPYERKRRKTAPK
jgi:two-component system, NtrC family, response regulator AtoC